MLNLSATESRILGCLLEKEMTTPDVYPLTLAALVTACNQTTSRDPVLRLESRDVEETLSAMKPKGLIRFVHSPSNRAMKYRQVLNESLHLEAPERAVICVLLLRGAQTSAELKIRTERLHRFDTAAAVEDTVSGLADRDEPLTKRIERLAGQKEARWIELLSSEPYIGGTANIDGRRPVSVAGTRLDDLEVRLARLEAEMVRLRALVEPNDQ